MNIVVDGILGTCRSAGNEKSQNNRTHRHQRCVRCAEASQRTAFGDPWRSPAEPQRPFPREQATQGTLAEKLFWASRWSIEVFFKQIKQTLKLADFLGHSANAVRWQIWSALLCYRLLRYQACLAAWGSSFRALATPEQAYFPSFG